MGLIKDIRYIKEAIEANSVNAVPPRQLVQLLNIGGRSGDGHDWAAAYWWCVAGTIMECLNNAHYYLDGDRTDKRVERFCRFAEANMATMWWMYDHTGYIVVGYDKERSVFYFPDQLQLQKATRQDGTISPEAFDLLYYSPEWLYTRRAPFELLKVHLNNINRTKASEAYLADNYGALLFVTSEGAPINPKDREDILQQLHARYGSGADKEQVVLSPKSVDLKTHTFPVKDLDFPGRVNEELKLIAGYYKVPYDILPLSGASTYANQEQAVRSLYRNCLSPFCEKVLAIGRRFMRDQGTLRIPSERLTFRFDNVPELADDRTADIEYKLKVADLVTRMKAAGLDTTQYEQQLKDVR